MQGKERGDVHFVIPLEGSGGFLLVPPTANLQNHVDRFVNNEVNEDIPSEAAGECSQCGLPTVRKFTTMLPATPEADVVFIRVQRAIERKCPLEPLINFAAKDLVEFLNLFGHAYALTTVSVLFGSTEVDRHYVAYRRFRGQWYDVNDLLVEPRLIALSAIDSRRVYALAYVKGESQGATPHLSRVEQEAGSGGGS